MKNAFTLIELLVVIAIIGILSSVILSSVHCAHIKAKGGNCSASEAPKTTNYR